MERQIYISDKINSFKQMIVSFEKLQVQELKSYDEYIEATDGVFSYEKIRIEDDHNRNMEWINNKKSKLKLELDRWKNAKQTGNTLKTYN